MVAERVGIGFRDADDEVGDVGRRRHEPHHPVHPDPPHLLLRVLAAVLLLQQLPLPPQAPPDHDEVHGDEEDVADGLAEGRHVAGPGSYPGLEDAHAGQPREVVEEEVDHLAGVGQHGERAELVPRRRRAPAQRVEARQEPARPERLAAQPGRRLPALGALGELREGGRLGAPVRQLGHVLERLHQLVDAIALRQEHHQLVQRVAGAHGWRAMRWLDEQ